MFISKRFLHFVTLDISYPRVSHFKSSYFDSDCFWDFVFIMSNYLQKKKKPNSSAYSHLLLSSECTRAVLHCCFPVKGSQVFSRHFPLQLLSFTQSTDLKFNEKLHNLSVSPRVISSLLLARER